MIQGYKYLGINAPIEKKLSQLVNTGFSCVYL